MTYPLYTKDEIVRCRICGGEVAKAGGGDTVGFGDGNGNHHAKCPGCGTTSIWDVTKSQEKADSHMALTAARRTAGQLQDLRIFAGGSNKELKVIAKRRIAEIENDNPFQL